MQSNYAVIVSMRDMGLKNEVIFDTETIKGHLVVRFMGARKMSSNLRVLSFPAFLQGLLSEFASQGY